MPELGAVLQRRRDDLLARVLAVGLAVDDAVDLDVEQVQLAVDGAAARRRGRRGRSCWRGSPSGALLDDRAGDQVDPSSRASSRAHVVEGPSSGSAPAASCSGVPSTFHFSGSTTSARAVRGGGAHEALGGRAVARAIPGRVHLDRRCAHAVVVLQGRTD